MRHAAYLAAVFSAFLSSAFGQSDAANAVCGEVLQSDDFTAAQAYACLTSTPFRSDVAHQLLDYWKTTMSFQSTLAYLRDPPAAYQQPPIDLMRSLDLVRTHIDSGVYSNQYSFEAAVQELFYAVHDSHVQLVGSILGVFKFGGPFDITTISLDGTSIPRVYAVHDIYQWNSSSSYTPSPLKKINGDTAEAFLAVYAGQKNLGSVEPHGDWNGIMFSRTAEDILGTFSSWIFSDFYPGENITIEFANGTVRGPEPWKAYNYQGFGIPSIKTGEDFYEYFVLGKAPQSSTTEGGDDGDDGEDYVLTDPAFVATATGSSDSAAATDTSSDNTDGSDNDDLEYDYTGWGGVYPEVADVKQPGLGYGGVVTGYFLNDTKVGVLSIPSFQPGGDGANTFSNTIAQFISRSKKAGMQKIVIDLQQNSGGIQLLATDTFHQFFPNIQPFSGMRTRSFDLANEIGTTFTNVLAHNSSGLDRTILDALIEDPFAVTSEINADNNRNFTSWAEYYGPHPDHGDQFSTVFTYNLSSSIFTENAGGLVIYGFGNRSTSDPAPYRPNDIILLSDGACGSTCDLFVELMHHEAGVRTIAIGGLPQYGPMQARGGTRGALFYTSDDLDTDMDFGCLMNSSLCLALPNRTFDAIKQSSLTLNLADQVRPKEYTPLQFTYEAADCRIYWTKDTFQNYTKLWQYAADANWRNTSLCVPHSIEHNDTMFTDLWGPSLEQKKAWAESNPAWVSNKNASMKTAVDNLAQLELGPGVHEAIKTEDKVIGTLCDKHPCAQVNQFQCRLVERCSIDANGVARVKTQEECRLPCDGAGRCPPNTQCVRDLTFKNKEAGKGQNKWFCEKLHTSGNRFCNKAANAVLTLPAPVQTAVNGRPIDVDFNA